MNEMTKKWSRTAALIGTVLLTAGSLAACSGTDAGGTGLDDCTPEHEFETVTPGELTVAAYHYPPYMLVEDDSMSGIEGDLLHEVAERQCLTLTIVTAGGASAAIPAVEAGRADIASGWYRSHDRAEVAHLSEPLYLDQSGIVSTQGLTVDDLEDDSLTFGSVSGMIWNDSMKKLIGDNFKLYQDDEAVYGDLASGRIDGVLNSIPTALDRLENSPIDGAEVVPLTSHEAVPEFEKPGQLCWPTSLDNTALNEGVDEIILDMHEDGTIAEILEKWGLSAELAETGEPYEL